MAERYSVLVTDDQFFDYTIEKEILEPVGCRLRVFPGGSDSAFRSELKHIDGLLVNTRKVGFDDIACLEKCRIISRYGVGFDNVDVEAAERKGIRVANVPDYSVDEVSDHAVGLLLSCVRLITFKDRAVRSGNWNVRHDFSVPRIRGKTLGIVGYGRIARVFHAKMKGFGPGEVLVCDPYITDRVVEENGARRCTLEDLLTASDFISLHVPLNSGTRRLIGSEQFSLMKRRAILVNTARGGVIDEAALVRALSTGRIRGAGLDVFEEEPIPPSHPLCRLDNVVLTDHSAYYGDESVAELKKKAALNVRSVLEGGEPPYPVHGTVRTDR